MSLMALHEDSPLSDYVYFPIVDINAETLQSLGASFTWSPVGDNDDRIFRFNFSNDNLYTAIGANMPRQRSSAGCIMKNRNVWENVQGVYERSDTIMTDIEVGTKPDDFDSNIHYMTLTTQTIDNQSYNIYNIKNRGSWSSTAHYYLDESTPENRHARLFYSDGGLSFGVFNAVQYSTSISARYRKFTGFSIAFPASSIATNVVYPLYWGYNGSTFNPNSSGGTGEINGTLWCPYNYVDGSQYVDEVPNYITFFAHIKLNNIDYYGAAVATMSADASDAYPRQITCCMWSSEYWGTSVVPGGDIPTGEWGPTSGQAGGSDGTWDYSSEEIPEQTTSYLPSAIGTGSVVKCYKLNSTNVQNLSERLYNANDSLWQSWTNKLYNPMAAVVSLHYLPAVFSWPIGDSGTVSLAGITLDVTGDYPAVSGYIQTDQWRESPTYTLDVERLADSFLDYSPYTQMALHLPFCGVVPIDPSTVTGGSIAVKYRCDAITGNVAARITCTDQFGSSTVLYGTGNCSYPLPLVGKTGGAMGLSAIPGLATGLAGIATGNILMAASGGYQAITSTIQDASTQTSVQSIPTTMSPMLDLCLWLEIKRAIPSTPEDKQEIQGIPANITVVLQELSGTGFTQISDVHVENIKDATQGEKEEIERLLKEGVIL